MGHSLCPVVVSDCKCHTHMCRDICRLPAAPDRRGRPEAPLPDHRRTSRIFSLRELIRALDRRVPHVERAGETRIARDAQTLRSEALARIKELGDAGSDAYDGDLVQAIMTDDGGPAGVRQ